MGTIKIQVSCHKLWSLRGKHFGFDLEFKKALPFRKAPSLRSQTEQLLRLLFNRDIDLLCQFRPGDSAGKINGAIAVFIQIELNLLIGNSGNA